MDKKAVFKELLSYCFGLFFKKNLELESLTKAPYMLYCISEIVDSPRYTLCGIYNVLRRRKIP